MYREWKSRRFAGAVVWTRSVSGTGTQHRILPDGCLDLIWASGALLVAGPDTRAHLTESAPGASYVGIRFAPGTGPAVLGVPASELRDGRIELAALWRPAVVRRISERLAEATDPAALLESVAVSAGSSSDPSAAAAVTEAGITSAGVSPAGVSPVGIAPAGVTAAGVSPAAVSLAGVSLAGVTAAGVTAAGVTAAGVSPVGVAPARVSPVAVAAAGVIEAGVIEAGVTEAGVTRVAVTAGPSIEGTLLAPSSTVFSAQIVAWLRAEVPVRAIAERVGLSERQLHRRCLQLFGYGPKTLARVLRFDRALRLARAGVPFAEVAARAGYSDQAHLSRNVRELAGVPLGVLVGRP